MDFTLGNSAPIPGIYNYCFRWCERCPFTDRCINFDLLTQMEGQEANHQRVAIVLRTIPPHLTGVIKHLERACEQAGYDWDEVKCDIDSSEPTAGDLRLREVTEMAFRFAVQLMEWLDIYRESEPQGRSAWREPLQLLAWYGPMVAPKVKRSLGAIADIAPEDVAENGPEGILSDPNATAKLASLVIVRALAALSVMLRDPAPYEEELLTFTLDLLRIQQAVRYHFPYAAAFERPGFDDPDLQDELVTFYDKHLPLDPYRDGPWQAMGGRAPQD